MRSPLAPPLLLVVWTLACADPPAAPDVSSAHPALAVVDVNSSPQAARSQVARQSMVRLRLARAAPGPVGSGVAAAATPLRVTILDVVDIGALACCTEARAVNGSRHVVGLSTNDEGEDHAFRWRPSTGMRDLGTLGGTFSEGNGINSLGHVVGTSETEDGAFHAFIWRRSGGLVDLGLPDLFETGFAEDVNDDGQVAGTVGAECSEEGITPLAATPGRPRLLAAVLGWAAGRTGSAGSMARSPRHRATAAQSDDGLPGVPLPPCIPVSATAARWEPNGKVTELGGLRDEGLSLATALNRSGQVVGFAEPEGDELAHAFFWDPGTGMLDIGTLGGPLSVATDVNSDGLVVGLSAVPEDEFNQLHAFVWRRGERMLDLGTLPGHDFSVATAINDGGHIIGVSAPVGDSELESADEEEDSFPHGFFFHPEIGMLDFGPFFSPTDVDNAGHIVGNFAAGPLATSFGGAVLVTYRIEPNAVPVVSRLRAGLFRPGDPSGLAGVWLRVRLSDRDDTEGWTWTIDWGDGTVHTPTVDRKGEFVFLRRDGYAEPGTYTITVSVTDPFGATSAPVSTTVTVPAFVATR